MAYFPFFMDLEGRDGLIVGGGAVALRKVEKLLPYGARLTVAAERICDAIRAVPGLTLLECPYTPELLEGRFFVIAATDDRAVNHAVASRCRELRIPVNVVDDRAACSFLFPSLVQRGPLSVGISTGGASPTAAVYVKERVQELLPEDFGALVTYLDSLRETVKARIPDERRRAACFARLFAVCMEQGWPLAEDALDEVME